MHKLLASTIHKATRLDATRTESETDAWVRYFTSYFPGGHNDPADARLLFVDWRTRLLKDDALGPGIAITHGQSGIHWERDPNGRLCLNLEDTWAEFAASVDSFVAFLEGDAQRRSVVLRRWRATQWVVRPFLPARTLIAGATVMDLPVSASFSTASVTALGPPPPKAPGS